MSSIPDPNCALNIFYCYANTNQDISLMRRLEIHLKNLQHQRIITSWHGNDISAGIAWEKERIAHLHIAHIILLLISPDFIASPYYRSMEMQEVMEKRKRGDVHIIPILLRPTDLKGSIIDGLTVLPTNAKPITLWNNKDEAFLNVIDGIKKVIEERKSRYTAPSNPQYLGYQSKHDAIKQLIEQERQKQAKRMNFSSLAPLKIDKDIIISYDLDRQMTKFNEQLNFGGIYAFVLGGQYNILRDYIIERMCRELKNKMRRGHLKIDISLFPQDLTEDNRYIIQKKITAKYQGQSLIDVFQQQEPIMDVVLTVWNHSLPPETTKKVTSYFWEHVTASVLPFLQETGQCFIIILANAGTKAKIRLLDNFTLLPTPEQFDLDRLTQWVDGWLKSRGVNSPDVEECLNRLRDNHGHFLATYQEIENIIRDLQGRYNAL